MLIRYAVAAFGVLAGVAMVARAQPPAPASPAPTPAALAFQAASNTARGATVANVVPSTFRMQLIVDNRFKQLVKGTDGTEGLDPRNRTGKMHCLVCEYGLSPVVAIFVRSDLKNAKATDGLAKLIKGTDALIPKYRSDKLAAFTAYLKLEGGTKVVTVKGPDGNEDKVTAAKEYPDDEKRDLYAKDLKDYATAVSADNVPIGLAPTTSPSVTAFGVDEGTQVTVIIYNRVRMAQRWELKLEDLTDEKIGEILNATEEMITGKKSAPPPPPAPPKE
jgi:hypothetical protein